MSIYNLDNVFRPKSVAVIGASDRTDSIGFALFYNLLSAGFEGKLFPVNPKYRSIQGVGAFRSVLDVKDDIDLAVVATPIERAPKVIRDCVKKGIKGAVIISAGGKEVGPRGREIEEAIREEAVKGGMRIIGPNCAGIICNHQKLNATFSSHQAKPGKLAFVSQSGALLMGILDHSYKENIGFSHFISIGSMLDVDFGDMIDYLGNDPDVSAIVLYIEGLSRFRKFMSSARAVSRVKPIVVLKSGRSPAGARAASSHTGSLVGEDAVYDAAFQRAGIVRVNTIEELFDCAELMAKQPLPEGPGLGIITNSGGPGVMAADALYTYGKEPALLSQETMRKLNSVLPHFWSRGNPVDVLGDATPERFASAVEICIKADEINGLLVIYVPQMLSDPEEVAAALVDLVRGARFPVFMVWMGGEDADRGKRIFNQAGVPTYDTPERAVAAFMLMCSYRRNLEMLQQIPQKLPRPLKFDEAKARTIVEQAVHLEGGLLTEVESKELLAAYGIPVNRTLVATSPAEAVKLAREIGYPVAMKIYSEHILHKSDTNGVQLNLRGNQDVRNAYEAVLKAAREHRPDAEVLGVTVQAMFRRRDYELILGAKRDPDFGPTIMFGMGGIMTEVIRDRAVALPPLNRLLARRLIEDTRVSRLLNGYRNRPPANIDLLEEILIRLSQLVIDFPEIAELDMNPVMLTGSVACVLDARVIVAPSGVPSPLHLAISPYPEEWEGMVRTRTGAELFVRPIIPEDAPLIVDLFNVLSRQTIYYRFFTYMKSLPSSLLARFTQVDYDRDVVLVGVETVDDKERIVGLCRLTRIPGTEKAEMAVIVGDPWQGRGFGAALLERCISLALSRGIEKIFGTVLMENAQMLALARRLGFKVKRGEGGYEFEIILDLNEMNWEEMQVFRNDKSE